MPGEALFREATPGAVPAPPALAPPPRPVWQRLLAPLMPMAWKGQWAWFRMHYGGRWARLWVRHDVATAPCPLGWRSVPACPAALFNPATTLLRSECTKQVCRCEVYP